MFPLLRPLLSCTTTSNSPHLAPGRIVIGFWDLAGRYWQQHQCITWRGFLPAIQWEIGLALGCGGTSSAEEKEGS
ncbi:hypothetical protein HCDG_00953 [Histoplasma capsulatum H143]|uniref:Uncharacterized protein n=1 Tax=Ajellomyces capsulatus (strain H143) TaxID=544712 RepID=C6H2M1_AJECH|nr:hypothetical protein HCDG_00953 [Histoplasma capsulatum H143]